MIDHYSFGSITIQGEPYASDLKIINGRVYPGWWRKSGHSVDIEDVTDMLDARPEYFVIGSGRPGLMKITARLKVYLEACDMKIIEEPTSKAVETFNRLYGDGKNVAAGFHLTC